MPTDKVFVHKKFGTPHHCPRYGESDPNYHLVANEPWEDELEITDGLLALSQTTWKSLKTGKEYNIFRKDLFHCLTKAGEAKGRLKGTFVWINRGTYGVRVV